VSKREFDIVIVGAGPAGLAAAAAASGSDGSIAVIDENPQAGGQIWRAEKGSRSSAAAKLLDRINGQKVTFLSAAQVFDAADSTLICERDGGRVEIAYSKLIIATGARELFLPFPGWTLQGVFGAGGLQALVKGGVDVTGKRVIVAGSGPLLLAVADHLKVKGAKVVAVIEQARAGSIRRFARSLWHSPDKLTQAAALRARLLGIPYKTDSFINSVREDHGEKIVTIGKREYRCDLVACGFHLVPNLELPSLLGCSITNGFVDVDERQQTSVTHVFCAGETTGIGGVDKSLIEGEIAALAVIGREAEARKLLPKRKTAHAFADRLNKTFRARDELKALAGNATILCRCEDVSIGAVKEFGSWRQAKLQTRCGMGPCQGRICGAAARFIFDWELDSARPPIYPVRLENL
jgi:NADPH-dependent 2,4-dienoyl-CoA reductase/sulfur reductase-like enzyme